MAAPRTFRCSITDSAIKDLHERIDRARWPDQIEHAGWSYGTELHALRELVSYWRHQFDWRLAEAFINQFDQSLLDIDGLDLHFIHQRSSHDSATPLLMTHGWPGSVVEFLDVIPRLTQPERFGGRAEDAFHVVCPSLPGYGFSAAATEPGMHTAKVAERHARLMAEMGYESYIAQGGDWGSGISLQTAALDPRHCRAVHLNLLTMGPPKDVADAQALVTPAERVLLDHAARHQQEGSAYMLLQSTKPQSLGYGLHDSPIGLCAWIAEKFQSWSDCQGDIRNAVSWDKLLTNISLYWFTGTITSSLRLYRETAVAHAAGLIPRLPVSVPLGMAVYPRDIYHVPRAWVER
ncbi:MAG TPA: epoxide hydrolase, partial [Ramlibacter sp.]|nr:epoxide hydrolase [Ramlibacter sp.]